MAGTMLDGFGASTCWSVFVLVPVSNIRVTLSQYSHTQVDRPWQCSKNPSGSSSFPSNQYVAFLGQPSMQFCKLVSKWGFPRKKLLGRAPCMATFGMQWSSPILYIYIFFFSSSHVKIKILKNSVFKYIFLKTSIFKFFKIPILECNFQVFILK